MKFISKFLYLLKENRFWKLFFVILKNPKYILGTFLATWYALVTAQKYFYNTHSKDGKGNAFRHALWNMFILYYSSKSNSLIDSLLWTKFITAQHEIIFGGNQLQNSMDLHNNEFGRTLFLKLFIKSRGEMNKEYIINQLLEYTHNSLIVNSINQIENTHKMVCLY
ncbi:MAG: hypothetical protein H6604_08040 [Flavobacteriales bacterium]|nr:hypothetical protein [Flavobacteriales bacterium]